MEAWREDLYSDDLYHHGILGQKHGQRNGPPYPLNASSHSASERKAGWKKSLNKNSKEIANSSKKAATQKASNMITNAIVKKIDKNGNGKLDAKEIVTASLKVAGTTALSILVTKGVNLGVDKTLALGKVATSKILASAANVKNEAVSNLAVNAALAIARKH